MGFHPRSYEAYCIDEAVMFFGTSLEHKLEQAGHKPSKEERKTIAARQRILDKVFGPKQAEGKRFADPMSFI